MLTKDEREQIAAQVRAAKDPSRSWSFWSVEYANDVAKLLHALDAADKRIAELEAEHEANHREEAARQRSENRSDR